MWYWSKDIKDYTSFKEDFKDTYDLEDRKNLCRHYLLQECSKVLGFKYDNKLRTLKEAISSLVELDNYLVGKKADSVWKYIESLESEVSRLQALEAVNFSLNPDDLDLEEFKVPGDAAASCSQTAEAENQIVDNDRHTLLAHEDVLFKPVYVSSFRSSRRSKWLLGRKNIKGAL